jgi:hypothetical protein
MQYGKTKLKEKQLIISLAGEATNQKIAKIGNNLYVVWSENGDIFFKRSTDNGAHFKSTINLSNDEHSSREGPRIYCNKFKV